MKKKWIYYLAFFVLLVLGFYFTMTRLMPGYGDPKLPVLNYVRPFSFVDQEGKTITEQDLAGKVYVAEYFFTTCHNICPLMNTNLKSIYEAYKNEPGFLIVSHTSDPENDSVGRLKAYADSMHLDPSHWLFLTGRKDSLYQAARVSYLLDDPKNSVQKLEDQFIHTQFMALVDKSGRVRKIYDGLKTEELNEMKTDIARLLKEPVNQRPFSNNIFAQ